MARVGRANKGPNKPPRANDADTSSAKAKSIPSPIAVAARVVPHASIRANPFHNRFVLPGTVPPAGRVIDGPDRSRIVAAGRTTGATMPQIASNARTDFFLKLDGVEGETLDHAHKSEIELIDWTWAATNTCIRSRGAGGASVGKAVLEEIQFTTRMNKACPILAKKLIEGQHFAKGALSCRKSTGKGGQKDYLVIRLKDVFITSYRISGIDNAEDPVPLCKVAFSFGDIEMDYKAQGPDGSLGGSVQFGFDVNTHKVR